MRIRSPYYRVYVGDERPHSFAFFEKAKAYAEKRQIESCHEGIGKQIDISIYQGSDLILELK